MTIKHLVLGGGGSGVIAVYGALKYLAINKFWELKDIKSIYSTSFGSIIGTYIILNHDWDTLDDYLVKRPWDKVINIKPLDIINIWHEKGIFNENIVKLAFKPLLEAKDLSENITLQDLYDYNSIEFHIYTTNLNENIPTKVDISYKTHPNLELCKAITMSISFPLLFAPICNNDNNCYIDGGLLNNFPLNNCIADVTNVEEILAIKVSSCLSVNNIDKNSTLIYYIYSLMEGMRRLLMTDNEQQVISNMITCKLKSNTIKDWLQALSDDNIRQQLIETGEKYGKDFLELQKTCSTYSTDISNSISIINNIKI